MADKKKGMTYIQEQLYKNRVTNTLKKNNDILEQENTLLRAQLKKLGYDVEY
tara:strand:- start:201 stop:356 length:156 start_codon:yes stop_codon:yes gene_type:complete